MKNIHIIFSLLLALFLISGCSDHSTFGDDQQQNISENSQNTPDKEKLESTQQKPKPNSSPENMAKTQNSNRFSVPLLYVVDGDTIKVKINGKEESVRFLLVDTPETNHPRLGVQPFGPEAKAFTKKLLSTSTVLLEKDVSERDKYGRLLMYVYTPDGRSVQEELLKNGLARVAYVYAPNTKYVDTYYRIQKDAQKRGVGIWSVENYAQEDGYHPNVITKHESNIDQKQKATTANDAFLPDKNGNCNGYIKGNQSSNGWIYHVPSGRYYNATKAEQCFKTEQAAKNAGYRESAY